jgi:hypothetical protein
MESFGQEICHFCLDHFSNEKPEPRPCKKCKHQLLYCYRCLVFEYEYDYYLEGRIRDICIKCKRYTSYGHRSDVRNYYNERKAQKANSLWYHVWSQRTFRVGSDTYLVKKKSNRRNSI